MLDYIFTHTPLTFFTESLWRDEAYSYLLAKRPLLEMLSLTARDYNPPFYYLLLHYWTLIFGQSEIALRSLSLIMFCGLLYVMHLCMVDIFRFAHSRSYRYLLLFLLNPVLVYYAFEARMYIMLAFLAALSHYAFLRGKTKLYYVATLFGLYTHYFMVLAVLVQGLYVILTDRKKQLFASVRILIVPMLIFIPWVIYVLSVKSPQTDSFWILAPPYKDLLHLPGIIYTGYERSYAIFAVTDTDYIPYFLKLSALLVFILSLSYYKLHRNQQFSSLRTYQYLLLWGFFPPVFIFLLSYALKPLYLPRYLILAVPGMVLALIYALKQLNFYPRAVLIVLLAILCVLYQSLEIKLHKRADFAKTFREIRRVAKKADLVYVTDVLSFFVAEYYFDENRVYVYRQPYSDIPAFVGKVLIPADRVTSVLPTYPQRAIILEDWQHYTLTAQY